MARTPWTLDRVLVALGAFSVLLAGFAFAGWSVTGFVESIPNFIPAAPGWIFAIVLAFYARPWVYLTAGILNAVLPLMVLFLFGAIAGLGNPTAGPEYQSLMLLLIGLVLSLTGGIAGFRNARQGANVPVRAGLQSAKGASMMLVTALLLGVLLTSGLASSAVKDMAAAGGAYNVVPEATAEINMADFAFSPRELRIPAGKLVEVTLTNEDSALHTFSYTLAGKDFAVTVPGEGTTKMLLKIDTPQSIHFWCEPHSGGAGDTSADSMWGTLIVE